MNGNNTYNNSSSRPPMARRAHFSQHETDQHQNGIDETLFRAAMADQAALHQEQWQHQPLSQHSSSIASPQIPNTQYNQGQSQSPMSSSPFLQRQPDTPYQPLFSSNPYMHQSHLPQTEDVARPSAPRSLFVPGYSLDVPPSTSDTDRRAQMSMPVSPLQIHRRIIPDSTVTDSPVVREDSPFEQALAPQVNRAQRRAQFTIPDGDCEDDDDVEEDPSSSWKSCRDRRPTSALVQSLSSNFDGNTDEEEDEPETNQESTLGSNAGYLSSKRASMQLQRNNKPGPLQNLQYGSPRMPQHPAQAHSHHRVTSEGTFPSPLGPPPSFRTVSGSNTGSIRGSTPHIQHYDPLSSPSMVQPYTPRIVSSSSFKSPNLKPAIVRHGQSYENVACELGMAGAGEGQQQNHRPTHRGGIRSALSGLYDRVVSSDHNKAHDRGGKDDDEENESDSKTSRPPLTRSSSVHSLGGTTLNRRGSSSSVLDDVPSLSYLNQRRKSMAFILGEDDQPIEADDPRFTGQERKSMDLRKQYEFLETRRASYTSEHFDSDVKPRPRSRSLANITAPLREFGSNLEEKGKKRRRSSNHGSLRAHMAERQKLILKLARALMLFGAPSHRVESQLNALSQVLSVDGQFIHFPGIVIASFGDIDKHTSECHFVKSKTDLALGHLSEVHGVYKGVISDKLTVDQGTQELNRLLKAKPEWSILSRVAFNAIRCGIMAPMNFGGSFIDAFLAGAFGGGLTFVQLYFAGNNPMFSNVFEITAAIVISFLARVLSTQSVFCYQATASAGLILVLPGYIILCGSLELASKNMIAGSVRMVYAIIYSLFLGFGIAIGSDLYYWIDPAARRSMWLPLNTQTEIQGSFTFANETIPHWSGEFTFTNGTKNALNTGSINCERLPDWPWYRQPVTPFMNILFVPLFSFLACFSLLHPFKSREVPVSIIIACVGYVVNLLANHYIFDRSDVVSAIGSFAIGVLGNVYSRLYDATAFTAMTVAILFLVPSGMAMAGGLAMTYKGSDGDLYSNGLSIGLRMVQVSIGITTGLFASALLVYMFGNKRKSAQLFAF